jgi:hypothetical protein
LNISSFKTKKLFNIPETMNKQRKTISGPIESTNLFVSALKENPISGESVPLKSKMRNKLERKDDKTLTNVVFNLEEALVPGRGGKSSRRVSGCTVDVQYHVNHILLYSTVLS